MFFLLDTIIVAIAVPELCFRCSANPTIHGLSGLVLVVSVRGEQHEADGVHGSEWELQLEAGGPREQPLPVQLRRPHPPNALRQLCWDFGYFHIPGGCL